MKKADKLKLCSGCRNNRYNMGPGYVEREGVDAPVTCTECWNLAGARVVSRKLVQYSQEPPWEQAPVVVLSCYSREGYACVEPEVTR